MPIIRTVYNSLQYLLGFSGSQMIGVTPLSLRSVNRLEDQPAVPAGGAQADEHTSLIEQHGSAAASSASEISFQRIVIAHLAGFLAGFPSVVTMLDLSSDAMAVLLRDIKNPEFRGTWERVLAGDWQLGAAIVGSYILSFLAMAPFNYYNTYKGILASGRISQDERDRILKIIDGLDDALKIPLKLLFGAPVGIMAQKSYVEIFGRSADGLSEVLPITWWGILSAGIPIGNVVTGLLKVEVPMLAHNLRRGFFARGKAVADPAAVTSYAARRELISVLFDALNAVRLLHHSKLRDINPQDDEATVIAKLLLQEPPKLKIWISEFIMRALGFYLVYYGTPFFKDLGEGAILYTIQALGGDTNEKWAQQLGDKGGLVSLLGFFLLWGTLMSDAVHRPFMRLFAEGKLSDSTVHGFLQTVSNFESWGEAANYGMSYLFGAGLGFTNIPFIAPGDTFVQTVLCAFLSNMAISANGFTFGRKYMGLMQKDIHDLLGGKVFGLIAQVATMSDDKVGSWLKDIKNALTVARAGAVTERTSLLEEGLTAANASGPTV